MAPNDGGLALGQAWIAAELLANERSRWHRRLWRDVSRQTAVVHFGSRTAVERQLLPVGARQASA